MATRRPTAEAPWSRKAMWSLRPIVCVLSQKLLMSDAQHWVPCTYKICSYYDGRPIIEALNIAHSFLPPNIGIFMVYYSNVVFLNGPFITKPTGTKMKKHCTLVHSLCESSFEFSVIVLLCHCFLCYCFIVLFYRVSQKKTLLKDFYTPGTDWCQWWQ